MKYRMIALDLDGTLVDSDRNLPEKNKQALFKAMDEGMTVVLSSGRPDCGMAALADELELDKRGGYVSAFNGAKIIDWKTKEIVVSVPLDRTNIDIIYETARSHGMALLTHEGACAITENPEDIYVNLEAKTNRIPVKGVDCFEDYITFPVYKFIATADAEKMSKVEAEVIYKLSAYYDAFRSNAYFLEIVQPGVEKGRSLSLLAQKLGIPIEETIACGDAVNDISMIKAAGLGVAMQNAEEAVKKAADVITLTNEECGIAYLLENMLA